MLLAAAAGLWISSYQRPVPRWDQPEQQPEQQQRREGDADGKGARLRDRGLLHDTSRGNLGP
jgi:hypothetical protein